MLEEFYKSLKRVLQECYTRLLENCYKNIEVKHYKQKTADRSQHIAKRSKQQAADADTLYCYRGVTVVSQWCYSGATVMLQWCQSGVTAHTLL
jgi:hypothetical protein